MFSPIAPDSVDRGGGAQDTTMRKIMASLLVIGFLATEATARDSCEPDLDPYYVLESLYANSEFVFVGHAMKGPITRRDQVEYSVSSLWKGPDLQRIWLEHDYPDKVRHGKRRLIFAVRNSYSNSHAWSDTLRRSCMPYPSRGDVESMLIETVGEPYAPDTSSTTRIGMILAAAISLGAGALLVLLWNITTQLRNVQKAD